MHFLAEDFRFSFRLIRKRPGLSLLVIIALALGIGANSAVFSVLNSVLLRPLPLSKPEQIVFVLPKSRQAVSPTVSYPEYKDWVAQSRSFAVIAAYQYYLFNLQAGNGAPEAINGLRVTASAFDTFGIRPVIGRGFLPSDERPGAAPVAVISHGLWQRRFGADPNIVGKTISLQSQVYTVVGVFPPNDFVLLYDVWVEIGPFLDARMMSRETLDLYAVGRLAPSVTVADAQKEMDVIAARLAVQYPKTNKDMGVSVNPLLDQFTSSARQPLKWMLIASGLVFILACVNITAVFVSNAVERRKELSVRLALGATRSVIWRQLGLQSLIYAAISSVVGLVLAKIGLVYVIQRFPSAVFRFKETTLDHTVFWFTVFLTIGSSILFSLLPGLYMTRLHISSELKGEIIGSRFSRFRSLRQGALIAFEITLAASLSLVTGLLIKSFYEVEKVNMGFNPHNILSFEVWLPPTGYQDDRAKTAFYQLAVQNLRAIPGIQSASGAFTLPAATGTYVINVQVDAQSLHNTERPFVDANSVLPGFLTSMKIPILQGRDFTDADTADGPQVAIVDEVLAARMWPGQSALGKRLRLADISDDRPPWREIVGVVRQVKYYGPERKVERLQVYEPLSQYPPPFVSFVMATSLPGGVVKPAAEKAIHDVDPALPLQFFQPLDDFVGQKESSRKISLLLMGSLAVIGIVLGMIGIFGVVSNAVVSRRREIAIRMALGADFKDSVILVMKVGLLATLAGLAASAVMVLCLNSLISSFLFGEKPTDPLIYLLSTLMIFFVALVASLAPAAALRRLSPQHILRNS